MRVIHNHATVSDSWKQQQSSTTTASNKYIVIFRYVLNSSLCIANLVVKLVIIEGTLSVKCIGAITLLVDANFYPCRRHQWWSETMWCNWQRIDRWWINWWRINRRRIDRWGQRSRLMSLHHSRVKYEGKIALLSLKWKSGWDLG